MAMQRALEAELSGLRGTTSRQPLKAFDEAARFKATTRILRHQVNHLKQTITLVSNTNTIVEGSYFSTSALWRDELDVVLQGIAEVEATASVSQSKVAEERRVVDLAYTSFQAELQTAIDSRDQGDRRGVATAGQLASWKKRSP